MDKFTHLFFDLDNTILDFDYSSHISFKNLLTSRGYHYNDELYETYKIFNHQVWGEFETKKIDALELRTKRFRLFLEKMNWNEDPKDWGQEYLKGLIPATKYVDKAEDLLKNLKDNFQLHVITNGLKEVQRPRIKAAGLQPLLSSITVSDEIQHAKPSPAFFEYAINQAGIKNKNQILVIGDSYSSDISGAHQFGLKSCWYNPNNVTKQDRIHDYEIKSISQLKDIL